MRLRVLVFDDDEAIRSVLWHILDSRGYEVFTFPEPGLCPLYLEDSCNCEMDKACGDIIISDVNMPNISGLEFVNNQIKKGCRVMNLALMSGAWSDSDILYAKKIGCHIFRKPFTIDEIDKWLDECEKRINPQRKLTDWYQRSPQQSATDELANLSLQSDPHAKDP